MLIKEEKPSFEDAKKAVQNMYSLNSLFLDSVKFNECECLDKYSYVSDEFFNLLWVLILYFGICDDTN